MNPAKDLVDQGLADLETNIGSPTFTWLGISYPCIKSSLRRGSVVEWGGAVVEIQFTIVIRQSVIAGIARPLVAGVTVFVDGVEYRVVKSSVPAHMASLHLDLIDAKK